MKSPFTLAWRYLLVQRKRTLLTAFGILMAVALVAATGLLVMSIQNMFLRQAIEDSGSWHYSIPSGLTKEQAETLAGNVHFEKAALFSNDTYARLGLKDRTGDGSPADSSDDNDYQYASINGLSNEAIPMLPYEGKLTEGRMPQNKDEVVLPSGALSYLPAGTKVGDQITWTTGSLDRSTVEVNVQDTDQNGNPVEYTREEERVQFHPAGILTYTLVGVYDESYPANRAVTIGPEVGQTYGLYVVIKPILHFNQAMDQALSDAGIQAQYVPNADVLRYWGQQFDREAFGSFLMVFVILAIIILAAMMMVIRNSFAISVGEKIAQFGVLRCVGATRKQIRHVVLSEGILMWVLAVPLGLVCSVLAMAILALVVRHVAPDILGQFHLTLAVWPFAAAVIMSFISVMLSAWVPAVRTGRISPIEAVRGNTQVTQEKIKSNRKGRVIGRIFGFSGFLSVKNMKRNTKRYRATLLSIIVSIALFLTLTGFSLALKDSNNRYGNTGLYDFSISADRMDMAEKLSDMLPSIRALPGVEKAGYIRGIGLNTDVPAERVQQDCLQSAERYGVSFYLGNILSSGERQVGINYIAVDRDTYQTLKLKGNAPSYDELIASGGALLCQTFTMQSSSNGLKVTDFTNYQTGESLRVRLPALEGQTERTQQIPIEGLLAETPWTEANRLSLYLVVPEENFSSVLSLKQEDESNFAYADIAVKAYKNQQPVLSETLKQAVNSTGFLAGFGLEDVYSQTKTMRDFIRVLDIFIYGFVTVVVMICSLNVFNTIGTNLQARRRELAMLRALGMQKRQLWRMQMVECLLYGLKGTLWGVLIGFPLQWLLMKSYASAMSVQFDIPRAIILTVGCFAVSIAVALLAGYSPIRKMVREPVVEGIRAQD